MSNSFLHATDVTQSSFDESSRNLSEGEHLPEDQDEELQMSLSSNGSSWVDLYPSMVSRIGRACHLQHVSEAASSVLRRYQRWRKQSKRASLSSTLNVTLRNSRRKPTLMPSSKVKLEESSHSPVRLEATPGVLQTVTSLQDRQGQQPSPSKDASTSTRPVRVIDFSETTQPRNVPLNETFIVSEVFPRRQLHLGEHVLKNTTGPSQTSSGTSRSSKETLLHLTKSSHSAESSTYSREAQAVAKRPDVYSSSVRQSPFKTKMMTSFSRSPQAFSRGLQETSTSRCSTESLRLGSPPVSLLSSPKGPAVQPTMLHPPSSRPQAAHRADGHRRFRRHLSFDSSLSCSASCSPKKVDEEFVKLYHKLVCQNKSIFFNSLPCRFCARSSEVSRGHSSSLAALSLSPHRSVLWKRHREMESSSCPKSKRHKTDMLMHCLSPYKLEQPRSTFTHTSFTHSHFTHSPRKHRSQPPAARQEAWMRGHRRPSAADLSVLGKLCWDISIFHVHFPLKIWEEWGKFLLLSTQNFGFGCQEKSETRAAFQNLFPSVNIWIRCTA